MMLSGDVISWQSWASSPAVGPDSQYRRKHVLELWAKANGKDSPQGLLDAIILDQTTPYETTNRFLNYLRDLELRPSTITIYRSMLGGVGDAKKGAGFFLSVIGEENFSVAKFNRLCPA